MKKIIKVIGLILISLVAGFYLLIVVGGLFEREPIPLDFETVGMAAITLLTVGSVTVAWLKIRVGVWLVLGVGLLFSIFGVVTAGQNHILAILSAGGPLILGGLLLLLSREGKVE